LVAEDIEGQALAAMIMNAMRGSLKVTAIKAPRYGEERRGILNDLAISVNAAFVSRESGTKLHEVTLDMLGTAMSIECTKSFTTIVGGNSNYELVEKRIESLKAELARTESMHDCDRIQERITRLASGVAVIKVGAATEIEMTEKKHRIEDALEAVRSAQLEGIIPGGGTSLLRAIKNLKVVYENEDQRLGIEIVKRAIQEPIRQMALNSGESPDIIVRMVLKRTGSFGYDFRNGKIVDMLATGIIDPVKVTCSAIANAASVAGTLITTNYAIVEI